jgi:hypothetical protein
MPDSRSPMINSPAVAYARSVAGTPYVDELVRRLREDGAGVEVERGGRGSAAVRFRDPRVPHVITLWTSDRELAAAVTNLGDCRNALWPDHTVESAGFNLLLVHVDEVVATRDTSEPLRITADGLQWPR